MRCPLCKTDNPAGSKFCNECGIRLPESSAPDEVASTSDVSSEDKSEDPRSVLDSIPMVEQATAPIPIPTDSLVDTARDMGLGFDASKTGEINLDAFRQPNGQYAASEWRPDKTAEMPAICSAEPGQNDFRSPEPSKKRKKGPVVLLIIAVIAVIVGALAALYAFGVIGGPLVPDVVGMSASSAESVLREKGFTTEIKKVKSDETEDTVLLTDPAANTHAPKGGNIILHVATGRVVPSLVGKTLDEAQELIKAEGLAAVTIEKVKSDEEENIVLEVSPAEGEKVKANTPIAIKVSEAYKVPNVVGMTSEQAAAAIEEEGLVPVFASVYDSDKPEDTVVSVSPDEGTAVKSGSQIIVGVARDRGKELVSIARSVLPGDHIINGQTYEISSVDSVSYAGNNIVQFTVTGRAYTYLDGEKVYGSVKSINGTMEFDDNNDYYIY